MSHIGCSNAPSCVSVEAESYPADLKAHAQGGLRMSSPASTLASHFSEPCTRSEQVCVCP